MWLRTYLILLATRVFSEPVADCRYNSPARLAIAIGIHMTSHASVLGRIVQESVRVIHNFMLLGSD
jgi:hypothetical protein